MERMRDGMARIVTGWDVEHVNEIVAEAFRDLIDPLVYEEAAALIEEHHAAGRPVVIVSSSGDGGRRADRRAARRRRRHRHPDGGRRRPLHRRAGVLRIRPAQGAGDPGARRPSTAGPGECFAYSDSAPTYRCWRQSGIRTPSTRTEVCAARRWRGAGPCCDFAHPVPLRAVQGRSHGRPVAIGIAGAAVVAAAARWRIRRIGHHRVSGVDEPGSRPAMSPWHRPRQGEDHHGLDTNLRRQRDSGRRPVTGRTGGDSHARPVVAGPPGDRARQDRTRRGRRTAPGSVRIARRRGLHGPCSRCCWFSFAGSVRLLGRRRHPDLGRIPVHDRGLRSSRRCCPRGSSWVTAG